MRSNPNTILSNVNKQMTNWKHVLHVKTNTKTTWREPLVEQKLPTITEQLRSFPVLCGIRVCSIFFLRSGLGSLFFLLLFAIVLSVILRFTPFYYSMGILDVAYSKMIKLICMLGSLVSVSIQLIFWWQHRSCTSQSTNYSFINEQCNNFNIFEHNLAWVEITSNIIRLKLINLSLYWCRGIMSNNV